MYNRTLDWFSIQKLPEQYRQQSPLIPNRTVSTFTCYYHVKLIGRLIRPLSANELLDDAVAS